jgi:murein DD-endopeptidase MepM/ murein hydrolase activator NlpD
MRMLPLLLPCLALIVAFPVAAKKIYKYTDANGQVHYTDQKPQGQADVTETVVTNVENRNIADLRVDGSGEVREAHVFNQIAGPVQVSVGMTESSNVVSEPLLPLTVVLGANEDRVLSRIRRADERLAGDFKLNFKAVPGDPAARAEDASYRLPLGGNYRIDQGFGGSFSHTDEQSRYAIDLAVDEGSAVLAAREGTVMQVENDFYGAGLNKEKFASRANVVRVLHGDGTMAVYAHLKPESVVVQTGKHVYVGTKLGESGNTGFSTGPHLHFCVQVNQGLRLLSIPFRLNGPSGAIAIPDTRRDASADGSAQQ